MQPRREPRRVAVPVENVERGRRIAEQIVVDPVVPDQVVRPHPREHARELPPFDHAGELRRRLCGNDRFRSDEHSGRRALRVGHVEHADRHRGAVNLALAAGGEMREEGGRGDASRARAPDVDVRASGELAHHVHRLLESADVRVEAETALGARGVLPADRERLEVALQRELHDALLGRQVEDVELVDLRRRDEERTRVDPAARGPVLDQLHHRIAVYDRAGRRREVPTDGELRAVHLGGQAAVPRQVGDEVLEAAREARAARVDQLLQRCGIAAERVGRGHRVDEERDDEPGALGVAFLHPRLVHEPVERAAPGEVGLRERPVGTGLLPRRIGEALVRRVGRELGAPSRDSPELAQEGEVLPGRHPRVAHHLLEQGARRIENVLAAHADQRVGGERVLRRLFRKVARAAPGFGDFSCHGSPLPQP